MSSILELARAEGWRERASYEAQISQCDWDEAYEQGRLDASTQASPNRWVAIL